MSEIKVVQEKVENKGEIEKYRTIKIKAQGTLLRNERLKKQGYYEVLAIKPTILNNLPFFFIEEISLEHNICMLLSFGIACYPYSRVKYFDIHLIIT